MKKLLLTLFSFTLVTSLSSVVVACYGEKEITKLTTEDFKLLSKITKKMETVNLNEELTIKELFFNKVKILQETIFKKFKEETNYSEDTYASKWEEFKNLKVQLNYSSEEYDAKFSGQAGDNFYWSNACYYKDNWSPVWENHSIKNFSLDAMSLYNWEENSNNWDYIKQHMFVSFGVFKSSDWTKSIDEKPKWQGTLLKVSFI